MRFLMSTKRAWVYRRGVATTVELPTLVTSRSGSLGPVGRRDGRVRSRFRSNRDSGGDPDRYAFCA
jgi:hypothetical protein